MTKAKRPAKTLPLWQHHLRSHDYAPATVQRYGGAVRRFLAWFAEQERRSITFDDLTPIALMSYRQATQQRAATSTTNLHVVALRLWCSWLTDENYLVENPAMRLKTVGHVEPDAPIPLSNNAINALLRAAQRSRHGERNYAICQTLLQTGIRLAECGALRWSDIQFGERKGVVLVRAGKGNKARTVPLNSSVRTALASYIAPRLNCRVTLRAVAEKWSTLIPSDPVWTSQKQGALSDSAIWRMFVSLVVDCAARNLVPASTTPHDLRHTFAHRYLEQHPGDLIGLARLLGHSNLETTRVYLRLSEDDLAARVEAIDLNAYV
ncbi:MAG: tyrosine-type recombinase/integrase [Anaerolineae bacterium]|nr:tyrosine-type recombinase/integrase [Anaerolineae bacterium]MCO5198272.1 tyrosine-type recombinase/integrase [Anaerolineae bacterium]MCO5205279.1 tyrosine-type recombinase/integrase [Anaerolineae bacterium]